MCFNFDDFELYDDQLLPPGDLKENHKSYATLQSALQASDPSPSGLDLSLSGDQLGKLRALGPLGIDFFNSDVNDLLSWTHAPPEQWATRQVLDWVYYYAKCHRISGIGGEVFNRLNGAQLCALTREDFQQLEPTHGAPLYDALQTILSADGLPDSAIVKDECHVWPVLLEDPVESPIQDVDISSSCYDIDECQLLLGYIDGDQHEFDHDEFCNLNSVRVKNETDNTADVDYRHGIVKSRVGAKARRRDRKSIASEAPPKVKSGVIQRATRGRKRGQTSKGNHLWEFVVEMLSRKDTSSVLCWENKTEGVFRFLQSAEVARLWGEKKRNKTMTYEKLSRAMRFCREKGYFAKVPRSGQYAKKLVFQFGPKAENWQRAIATDHSGISL